MKTLALVAAGISTLALAACVRPPAGGGHHKALKPISRLNCPASQGGFERATVGSDGKTCTYTGPDGAQLQLNLVSYAGEPDSVLDPIEAQMNTLLPPASTPVRPVPPAPPGSSAPGSHDNVDINLPGISIHAGDKDAKVNVGGVHIDADDQNNSVKINGGGRGPGGRGQFTVDANDDGAVVRSRAFGPNIEQSLIRVSKIPGPGGWRTLAYDAVGPKGGPLVVGYLRSRTDNHDVVFDDVKALTWKTARRGD